MQAIWLRRSGAWIEQHPLLFALGISVVVHILLIMLGATVLGIALLRDPSLLKQIAQSPEKIIELTAQRLENAPPPPEMKLEPEREMPMLFIEVDPTRPGDVSPEKPKFYAAQNSLASNPDTKLDTDQPKIDGKQTDVLRSFTAPRTEPKPLQPAQPQSAKVEAQPERNTKQPNPRPNQEQAKNQKQEKAQPGEKSQQPRGDLDPLRPVEKTAKQAVTPDEPYSRPKTIAQAKAQLSDRRPPGDKMQQDGGVKRLEPTSNLAAGASPLGMYDAKIVEAIKYAWYGILDERPTLAKQGLVVVEFRLHSNGSITELRVTKSTTDDLLASYCQLAIDKPAPFEPWPTEVRRQFDKNYRDVRFTFFYQ